MTKKKSKPNFYAVLPADVRYCEKISSTAKLVYSEISALTNKEGYCWASNSYFSKLFKKSKTHISSIISSLEENGFIKTKINREKGNIRRIYIYHEKHFDLLKKTLIPIKENHKTPIKENHKNNNIKINNKKNNGPLNINTIKYINRFNELFGRKYRATDGIKEKMKTRLKTFKFEEIMTALENISKSNFHRGDNDSGWEAKPKFLIRNDDKVDEWLNRESKVVERRFDNKEFIGGFEKKPKPKNEKPKQV